MKKLTLLALTAATALTAAALPVAAQAAAPNSTPERKYIVIGKTVQGSADLKEILSGLESKFPNGYWSNCLPQNPFPDINKPDKPDADKPDTDKPDNNVPDTETPDTDKPDTDKPDFEAPDQNQPGGDTSKPETPDKPEESPSENSYAAQVVALVNKERQKAGLSPLTLDKSLESAALIRAKETEISFSHTRPNGTSFSSVLKEQGIPFRGAGENIAWGQSSPEAVMNAWMNSDGHRANILNAKFKKIGVGYYRNANGRNYWTQLFIY